MKLSAEELRAKVHYQGLSEENYRHTDRMFAILMLLEWVAGIIAAIWISPKTWVGTSSQIHLHLWMAIFLGGVLSLYPVFLAVYYPGKTFTRHVIAVAQMLISALLIHLTGGRIETHFHVFGSLAFLSFYRDWKVLVPATLVVVIDHWVRGVYWPQSVYGVLSASPLRWLEHAGWVVFEDIFLFISCRRQAQEMWEIAERTAKLECLNEVIEVKVSERTKELEEAKQALETEVAERKRLEQVMIQSEKIAAIGQLAAGVAHEINNPLGVILGFSQGVVKRMSPGDVFLTPLKSIEREALRCKQLVQDLLTFSRTSKVEKDIIDIQETVQSALSLVFAQSKVKGAICEQEIEPDLPKILANRGQVQQIVINLCHNAIDSMKQGGRFKVNLHKARLRDGRPGVRLQVIDSGTGIPEEIRSKIFNPFFTTKDIGKGTGLGLSLVYEIVQKHEGEISFDTEVNRGTTFHVLLPMMEKEGSDGQR